MSCNSCSNVTLPGVVGPAGADGAAGAAGTNGNGIVSTSWTSNSGGDPQGTQGTTDTYTITYDDATTSTFLVTNGANGTDGVTILHYDVAQGSFSPTAIGTTSQVTPVIKRAFSIPANTWETNGDMIELEIMAIGQRFEKPAGLFSYTAHSIYVDLDGNPIEMDIFLTAAGSPGYVYAESRLEPLLHLKLQLMLTDSGLKSILPITDFKSNHGTFTDLSSANVITGSQSSNNWNHRGVITTPGPALNAPITLNVSAVSADVSVNINMFYAKITSYKKS